MYHTPVWEVIGSRKRMLRFGWQFASPDLSRTCFVFTDLPGISSASRHIPTSRITKVPRCQDGRSFVGNRFFSVTWSHQSRGCSKTVECRSDILWEVLALDAADCRRGVSARTATLLTCATFLVGCNMSLVAAVADRLLILAESTCKFTDSWWTGAAADWSPTYTNHRSWMKPFHFFWLTDPDRAVQNLSIWGASS